MAIRQDAGEVTDLAEDCGERGARNGLIHFVQDAEQAPPQNHQFDGSEVLYVFNAP